MAVAVAVGVGEGVVLGGAVAVGWRRGRLKLSAGDGIELAMGALEDTLKSEDVGKIKGGIQNLTDAAMRLGEAIYKASAEAGEGKDEDAPRDVDDDVVDADFEDLGNNKRK